ncbi:MAG: hypothetical protein Kow0065_03630 [Methylomicrobium sp.]
MSTTPCCVFTIVSKNYLHYAINLMQSVAEFMPDCDRVVALCDKADGIETASLPFKLIALEELNIEYIDRLLVQYTILELNTAIKPSVFKQLFEQRYDRVIYFDPDIQLFSTGAPLLETLDRADIVLTPHLTDFLDDDKHPSEIGIMQSGVYNLGFMALRDSSATQSLLGWWQKKLQRYCVSDVANGLFTDQKWIDLVPGIFETIEIVRNPGWNIAYWNLGHRQVEEREGIFTVNGEPLFFFHFSGYEPGSAWLSKHQNRFHFSDVSPACKTLFELYRKNIDACGRKTYANLRYAYHELPSGIGLCDTARALIRRSLDWDRPLPDLRSAEGEAFIVALLNKPVDTFQPTLTALAMELYRLREDLQKAFPDVFGAHRIAYRDWLIGNAQHQAGFDPIFLQPMRQTPVIQSTVATSSIGGQSTKTPAPVNPWYRFLYQLAWSSRAWVRPFIKPELRHQLRLKLLSKAYNTQVANPSSTAADSSAISELPRQKGVNVIGYLRAESGVGESARSMMRALKAAQIPHAAVNFSVGNVSRQEECIDDALSNDLQYDINLFHINADQTLVAREHLGERFFNDRYRIGFWAWELDEFPDDWLNSFSYLDEIWTPSSFCQRAIAQKSPLPVVCIPHTVVIPDTIEPNRAKFGLREDTVCFLSMADMLSVPERKNPLGAVQAFVDAFGNSDQVELLVKLSNSDRREDISNQIRALAKSHHNIHLYEGYLERRDIFTLLDSIDCFVSLHRSEGFGLVIAEAMARGKAVVATGWSGNADFMTAANSMIVDYRLVELEHNIGPYRKGCHWAEPDLHDAAKKMRALANDAVLRALIGVRAKEDCVALLSDRAVGRLVEKRLDAIIKPAFRTP